MTAAADLVAWARGLSLDAVPAPVRHAAGRHLLDGVGNAVAARRLGHGAPAWTVAEQLAGPAEARPLTGVRPLSAPAAALATGVLVHALDFDDTHAGGLVHATAVTLPAALSVGQQVGASGAEVLAAAVVGLETVCRIGAASPHGFHARGLHATAVAGPLTAALVGGTLMKLSPDRLVDALGIAGSASGGLLEFLDTGADTKALHPGTASLDGLLALRLAAAGAAGPDSVLEGRRGVFAALSAHAADTGSITADLGERWETTRIGIKPYPACQLMHVTLDAVAAAVTGRAVAPAEVTEIAVDVHPDSVAIVCGEHAGTAPPRSPYDAKFDLPWSVAALLHDGSVTVDTYTAVSIARPEIAATAALVRVVPVPSEGAAADAPGSARVRLRDGRILTGRVRCSRGTAAAPLSDDDLYRKFAANCGEHPRTAELAERVLALPGERDLTGLLDAAAEIAASRPTDPAA
ncbi:MmgE/PrpD family protein [Geodermatophilus sp. SYSU D01176]